MRKVGNQTLLNRDLVGYYEFSHKSLAEFFVGVKLAAELGCINRIFTETYQEAGGAAFVFPYKPLPVDELPKTFGLFSLRTPRMHAIRELLGGMLSEDAGEKLLDVINSTPRKRRML